MSLEIDWMIDYIMYTTYQQCFSHIMGLEKKIFLISFMYFRNFVTVSPWKKTGPLIWTNLNPLHQRMLCGKFGWNWPSGSGEEDFFYFSMYSRYFVIISPLKRAGALIWTNLNPFHPWMLCEDSPKDASWQVWLKLAQWFWRRRFINFVNSSLPFRYYYLHLEKDVGLHLNKLESPSLKDTLCQVWKKL